MLTGKRIKTIIIGNENEKKAVMEKLEKEGYRWSSGDKPTELSVHSIYPFMLYMHDDYRITFSITKSSHALTAEEFMEEGGGEKKTENGKLIKKGGIKDAILDLMLNDKETRELVDDLPILVLVLGLVAAKIEKHFFN